VTGKLKRGGRAEERSNAAAEREKVFAAAYVANGMNGKEAAVSAGFSMRSAAMMATRLLKRPSVQKMIQDMASAIAEKFEVTAERNIEERARLAYYDIGKIAAADIKCPADIAKLPEDLRRCIVGWKWKEGGKFELQFADRHAHLTALDKHLGLYDKDNRQKGAGAAQALAEFFQAIYGDRNKLPIAGD
jgi:phage terminase small subunit